MNIAGIATVIYGGLIEAGGVIGFLVAKSKPSLIAGAVLGNLALLAGVLLLLEVHEGRWLAIGAAGLVAVVFAIKLGKGLAGGGAAQEAAEEKGAKAAPGDPAAKPKKGTARAAALVLLSLAEIAVVLIYA